MIMKTLTINGQTFIVVDADAMKKIADSDLDMNGRFIHNVLNGNEDNDAATVGQVKAVDLTTEKALTDEQMQQARRNIGALGKNITNEFISANCISIDLLDPEGNIFGAYIMPKPNASYGEQEAAVLEFYGALNDEQIILRNIVCVNAEDAANKGYVDKLVGDIETAKLDKPAETPKAGEILKVKSVNEDGTFTCEWERLVIQNEPIHITLEEAVSQVNVDTSDFTVPINKCSKITVVFSLPATGTEYKFNSNIKFASSRNKKDVDVLITNASYGVTTVAANLSANVFVTIENHDGFISSVMRYSHKASNLVQLAYANCCHENLNEKFSGVNVDSIIFTMSGAPAGTKISIYSEAEGGFEA